MCHDPELYDDDEYNHISDNEEDQLEDEYQDYDNTEICNINDEYY